MKFLVQNYATNDFTEPLYISESINRTTNSESTIWSGEISAFDIFDIAKPDLFITHFSVLSNDTVKYLSGNKNISLVLNITGANQEHINMLEGLISSKDINCPLIFSNQPESLVSLPKGKLKLVSVMHGADMFLSNQNAQKLEYSIGTAILTDHKPEGGAGFDTYHLLSHDQNLADSVDLVAPSMHMFSLYENYDRVIIASKNRCVSQSVFDAIIYANEAYYYCANPDHEKEMSEIVSNLVTPNLIWRGDPASDKDIADIKNTVMKKHTCFNRVKDLLNKLGITELEQEIDSLAKESINNE